METYLWLIMLIILHKGGQPKLRLRDSVKERKMLHQREIGNTQLKLILLFDKKTACGRSFLFTPFQRLHQLLGDFFWRR
jgi:hypothetical protein